MSVNNESVERLAEWSGMPEATLKTSAGYEKLTKWIMGGAWWNSTQPEDTFEGEVWSYRAALMDGLIYGGAHFAAHM